MPRTLRRTPLFNRETAVFKGWAAFRKSAERGNCRIYRQGHTCTDKTDLFFSIFRRCRVRQVCTAKSAKRETVCLYSFAVEVPLGVIIYALSVDNSPANRLIMYHKLTRIISIGIEKTFLPDIYVHIVLPTIQR